MKAMVEKMGGRREAFCCAPLPRALGAILGRPDLRNTAAGRGILSFPN
jgi:hypothetical protein